MQIGLTVAPRRHRGVTARRGGLLRSWPRAGPAALGAPFPGASAGAPNALISQR